MYIVGFLLVLGPLVTLHELGHYLVGRWFGVKADAFSLGFGQELSGCTDKRGTRWKALGAAAGRLCPVRRRHEPGQPAERGMAVAARRRTGADLPGQAAVAARADRGCRAGDQRHCRRRHLCHLLHGHRSARPIDPADSNIVRQVRQGSAARNGRDYGSAIASSPSTATGSPTFEQIVEQSRSTPAGPLSWRSSARARRSACRLSSADDVEHDRFGNASHVGRLGLVTADFLPACRADRSGRTGRAISFRHDPHDD